MSVLNTYMIFWLNLVYVVPHRQIGIQRYWSYHILEGLYEYMGWKEQVVVQMLIMVISLWLIFTWCSWIDSLLFHMLVNYSIDWCLWFIFVWYYPSLWLTVHDRYQTIHPWYIYDWCGLWITADVFRDML